MPRHKFSVVLDSAKCALAVRVLSHLGYRWVARLPVPLLVAAILALSSATSQAETRPRSVLVLSQSDASAPGYAEVVNAARAAIVATSPVRFYTENLDLNNFPGLEHRAALRNFVRDKYRDVPFGVFLAVGASALAFAMDLQTERWESVPIVFAAVHEAAVVEIVNSKARPYITGRPIQQSLFTSVEVARALVPDVKQVALVGDPWEMQPFRHHFKTELMRMDADLTMIDLTGLALAEVLKRVAVLPDDTVIVFTALTNDGAGKTYHASETAALVAQVANRPIVVDVENRIGTGVTGGSVVNSTLVGREAAQLVLRILAGEDASKIPVETSQAMRPVFDTRQLKRWGIAETRLPPGSEVRFHAPAAWEIYRTQFVAIMLTVLLQSVLIGALLYEDRRRRAAEARSFELSSELAHVNRVATAGELAASIAHEVRQPLAAIVARGSAGLNWLKKTAPDLDRVRDALESVVDNGHRADQVLRNTRAMFGKGDTSQETLNINKVIDEVLALVENRIAEERVQLIKSYSEMPLPTVRANRVELQQVLLNLVMNAIEAMSAMPRGDRVLKLTTEVTRTSRVLIAVQDSGPGIASDQLNLIFKSFFTTKPGGMGVGLSISRTIVEAHGGQLTVARGNSVGMVFTIDLPLRARRQQAANNHKPAADSQHSSPNR